VPRVGDFDRRAYAGAAAGGAHQGADGVDVAAIPADDQADVVRQAGDLEEQVFGPADALDRDLVVGIDDLPTVELHQPFQAINELLHRTLWVCLEPVERGLQG
jgi:hypothetical protein